MTSKVNPNQPVGQESITVDAGGSVSFDDMLKASGSSEPKAAAPEKKAESAPAKEAASEKKGGKEEKAPAEKATEEKVAADKAIDTKPGASKPKTLKGKNGEEQFDVPADVILEATVDGQAMPVSVQELLNNYSGKVAYDKKFTEVDKVAKQTKAEREQLETLVSTFYEKAQNPDTSFGESIGFLAKMAGIDPIKFIREFRQKAVPELEKFAQMTPDQRRAFELEEENKYLRSQDADEEKARQTEEQKASARSHVESVIKTAGMGSEEVFWNTYDAIVKDGKVPEDSITADYVASYYAVTRQFERVDAALDSIDPDLKAEKALVNRLVSLVNGDPSMSDEELLKVAETFADKKARKGAKSLSDKVRKNTREDDDAQAAPATPQNQPLTFDDL